MCFSSHLEQIWTITWGIGRVNRETPFLGLESCVASYPCLQAFSDQIDATIEFVRVYLVDLGDIGFCLTCFFSFEFYQNLLRKFVAKFIAKQQQICSEFWAIKRKTMNSGADSFDQTCDNSQRTDSSTQRQWAPV